MGNAAPITFRTSARSGGGGSASRLRSGHCQGRRAVPRGASGTPPGWGAGSAPRAAPRLRMRKLSQARAAPRRESDRYTRGTLHVRVRPAPGEWAPRIAGSHGEALGSGPRGGTSGTGGPSSWRHLRPRLPASPLLAASVGRARPSGSDTPRRSRALPGLLGGCEHPRHLLPPVPACGGHAAGTGTGSAQRRPPHGLAEGRARRAPPELSRDFRRREASPAQTVLPRGLRRRVPASPARPRDRQSPWTSAVGPRGQSANTKQVRNWLLSVSRAFFKHNLDCMCFVLGRASGFEFR